MFLQSPYFSTEGALGLPKAKSWWEHCNTKSQTESPEFKSLAMLEKIANWFAYYWLKFLTMLYVCSM